MKKLVIVGLGETAELACDYFTADSDYEVVAFVGEQKYLEQNPDLRTKEGRPIVALERLTELYPPQEVEAFIGISYPKLNHDRSRFFYQLKDMGYRLPSFISSKATVHPTVKIGENCFIMEDNILQRNVTIGDNVILWCGNHIGHRSSIGSHTFVSCHVAVSGFCTVGEYCFLAINSALGNHITIADHNFIGAGVTITHDTNPGELYRLPKLEPHRLSTKIICGY